MRIYLKCNSEGKVENMIKSGREPEEIYGDTNTIGNNRSGRVIVTLTKKDINDIIALNGRGVKK